MTKLLLAIFCLLPLAVLVGCGDPDNCTGDECVDCGDNCTGDDDTATPDDFEATLRSVAPYGWAGDHYIYPVGEILPDPDCTSVVECDVDIDEFATQKVWLSAWNFSCVTQEVVLNRDQDGTTVGVSDAWLGEGICGLAPEGDYDGFDVFTDVVDKVWIHINSNIAVITNDTFYYKDSDYLLEGTVAEDLSSITYHLVIYNEDGSVFNEWNRTINLED